MLFNEMILKMNILIIIMCIQIEFNFHNQIKIYNKPI